MFHCWLAAGRRRPAAPGRVCAIHSTPRCPPPPRQVVELMAAEKGWSRRHAHQELERALAFLNTFDSPVHEALAATAAKAG